jgi:hypothetical protein
MGLMGTLSFLGEVRVWSFPSEVGWDGSCAVFPQCEHYVTRRPIAALHHYNDILKETSAVEIACDS